MLRRKPQEERSDSWGLSQRDEVAFMSAVVLPDDIRRRVLDLIEGLCGAGPDVMSPGMFSVEIVPDKCFKFVEAIDQLLRKHPGAVELLAVKASALRLAYQNKSAEDVYDAILAIDPDHFDAGMTQEAWDTWPHLLQMPPCSEQMRRLPRALGGNLAEARNVQLVRDGLDIGVAFAQDITEIRFDHGLSASMRCQWQFVLTDSPSGRVVAHYVLVEDNAASPYRQEFFLTSGKPEPPSASSGYWLLQRLAKLDSAFIILARGDDVRYVRRYHFPPALRDKVKDIAGRLERDPKPTRSVEDFQRAVQWHMSHFDFESVRFQDEPRIFVSPGATPPRVEPASPVVPEKRSAIVAPQPPAAVAEPPVDEAPAGFVTYRHPEGLFSLAHPVDWEQQPPISEDAAFACMGPPPFTLVEVHVMKPAHFEADEVKREANLIEECLYMEHPDDGDVVSSESINWLGGRAERIVVEYEEKGHSLTTDYFLLSARPHVLMVALKTLSDAYYTHVGDFEQIVRSVRAPHWQGPLAAEPAPASCKPADVPAPIPSLSYFLPPLPSSAPAASAPSLPPASEEIPTTVKVARGFRWALGGAVLGGLLFQLAALLQRGGAVGQAIDIALQRMMGWLVPLPLAPVAAYALAGALVGAVMGPLLLPKLRPRYGGADVVTAIVLMAILVGVLARVVLGR